MGEAQKESREAKMGTRWNFSRLVAGFTKNGCLVAIITGASCITAVSTFTTTFIAAQNWYNNRYDWQTGEYKRLALIRAGYTIEKFREQLGAPSFESTHKASVGYGPERTLTDFTFQRHGYWVDAIADSNAVVAYSVTSCQSDFRPTFFFDDGSGGVHLKLNQTPILDASRNSGTSMRIAIPGSTANAYVFEIYGGVNPTDYRTFAWGLNDACPWEPHKEDLFGEWLQWSISAGWRLGQTSPFSQLDKTARGLAAKSLINTYAETAPGVTFDVYPQQIGVDRVAVR